MRTTALRFLCCPDCRGELRLEPGLVKEGDVESGWLVCPHCPKAYPIVRGIPRFVAPDRYAVRTDLQWNIFSANPREVTNEAREAETLLQACTGWTGQDYRGRLVLDVGTGAGSFAEVVATFGGEVVGVDFNAAVDVAYHRLRRFKNVHLVQADLSALPFCEETFDLAYSMGVLHHTPDPATAFVRIAGAVKSSGGLALLLHNQERLAGKVGNLIRRVTTRLPLGAALALTAVSIPFYCACRLPVLGAGLEAIYPIRMRRHWRGRWLETFEWCTATYQWPLPSAEVERWFRTNGFHNVELLGNPVRVRSWKEPAAANNVQSVLRPPLVARG